MTKLTAFAASFAISFGVDLAFLVAMNDHSANSDAIGLRLHLGCGSRILPGYVHVDLADYPHIAHRRSLSDLACFENESADLIYASHCLEYFDRQEVVGVLGEWYRVLKPGGVLRLAVPDFRALIDVYRRSGDLATVLGPLFGRWCTPGLSQPVYHKTVYDFDSLSAVLAENGFDDCRIWDWRKVFVGELAGFDDFSQAYHPHMDKDHGLLVSLNVEAIRS